jgi:6-pyruvoyltetrahydropterin/6-carboxytetrahydropterin synthase
MQEFHVRISNDDLIFSAGHFITLGGGICERLHGHNYRVAAELAGPLDENCYVVDFGAVSDALKSIVGRLDHRMLLPSEHSSIEVNVGERQVEVKFEDRDWVFPREDCVLLPLENTTAELLARYIAQSLLDALQASTGRRPEMVRIEVEECPGQSAVCELRGA